jgi:putative ABC transport system permease protein
LDSRAQAVFNPKSKMKGANVPDWRPEVRRRLANLKLAPTREAAIVEELAQHLADCYAEWLANGATPAEAERRTHAELSESELLARQLRRVERQFAPEPIVLGTNRRTNMIADLWQDLRYGAQMLLKHRSFTLIAVLTLALGIGANTAIFSVVNAVLLSPLPYRAPDQLVQVWENNRPKNKPRGSVSPANFLDWKGQNRSFEGMAAYDNFPSFNLTGVEEPERIQAARVSVGLFPLLGVSAVAGRTFTDEEERRGRHQVALVSNRLWQRRFGADQGLVGRTLSLNDQSFTVVGILPPDFRFFPEECEIFIPMVLDGWEAKARGTHPLHVVARLKAGVTLQQAQADMDQIARRLEQEYPNTNTGEGITLVPLQEQLVGESRRALLILLGAVACVLLIACANVANLLLMRSVARHKEMAVRLALGAGRARLLRQLLTESALLAGAGGVGGLLLSLWGVQLLKTFLVQNELVPRGETVGLDGRVLLFTLGISLVTGLVFGLAPGLAASKTDLNDVLKEGGRRAGGGARDRRFRQALVVGEVALALVLLTGAGLMIQSFMRLRRVDPGFRPESVLAVDLSLPSSRYKNGRQVLQFQNQLLERAAALPGVAAVGAAAYLPFSGTNNSWTIQLERRAPRPAVEYSEPGWRPVTADYFRTMGIPLLKGRDFATSDDDEAAPGVAIINETAARAIWSGEEPLGNRFKLEGRIYSVVGVVKDVKHTRLDGKVEPEIYFPYSQLPITWRGMTVVARTESAPEQLAAALRRAVQELDKDQPIYNVRTLEGLLAKSVSRPQFHLLLLGSFATLALIMAALGLYGVMSYAVSQRTHEIGIRMAFGAQPHDALRLVVGAGLKLTLIGIAIGLLAAFALTRVMESLLFGVSATDPLTSAAVACLLLAVALLACYLPARRATKVDPMIALRTE